MKIVGGRGIGADNEKMRVVEIEDGDVAGKQFQVHCHPAVDHAEGNDLFITYYEDGPSGRMVVMLDDPVETAEPPAPLWVKPERDLILAYLDGQIADAEAAMRRVLSGTPDYLMYYGIRTTLINCKRMVERKEVSHD